MPSLHRSPAVLASYALNDGRLTFRTDGAPLSYEARSAMASGRNLTVSLAAERKDVNGKVLSVTPVDGATPAQWDIVIRLSA